MKNCNCQTGFPPVNEPFFCPKMQAYIVRGPKGATGAQGPQGPRGLDGIIDNSITVASPDILGVTVGGAVPFTQIVTQNGTNINIAVGDSNIALPRGTYLILYNMSVRNDEAQTKTATFALVVDDEMQTGLSGTATVGQNQIATIGGNAILNVATDAVLSLVNSSGEPINISNVILSVVKLV